MTELYHPQAGALFDYLGKLMASPADCDHSFRHCEAWAGKQGLDWAVIEQWLRQRGAHCDCEVVMNVAVPFWEAGR